MFADVAVAAALAGAGDDEVAHAGQAGERLALAAHRLAELRHLVDGAGHHQGAGVLADAQRVAHADGDRVDVLQRTRHLDADDVVGGVCAETLGAEQVCQIGGQVLVGHGEHGGGGVPVGDLAGDVGAGQDSCRMAGQHLVDDLAHPVVGALLEALHQGHHRNPRP